MKGSKEMEKIARDLIDFSEATQRRQGHKRHCKCWWCSLLIKLTNGLTQAEQRGAEREREECAKLAEKIMIPYAPECKYSHEGDCGPYIAKAISSRGEKEKVRR